MKTTRFLTLILLLPWMFSAHALDFTIEKVIPIGPCDGGMYFPAQWSPNGVWLAYFSGNELRLADSLGQSHTVCEISMSPHRFCWSSNNEILLFQRSFPTIDSVRDEMVSINPETGNQTVIESAPRKLLDRSQSRIALDGPYATFEDEAYYCRLDSEGNKRHFSPNKASEKSLIESQHVLTTGSDALYLVQLDGADSIKISNKPYKSYMGLLPMSLSPDTQYIMFGGNIVRLSDDTFIMLDTLAEVQEKPAGTKGCGFGSHSFNPRFTEVAFRLGCDDGHAVEVLRAGVYDYASHEFAILDSMTNLSNCNRPVYHPFGRDLALMSKGVLYVVKRKLQ